MAYIGKFPNHDNKKEYIEYLIHTNVRYRLKLIRLLDAAATPKE